MGTSSCIFYHALSQGLFRVEVFIIKRNTILFQNLTSFHPLVVYQGFICDGRPERPALDFIYMQLSGIHLLLLFLESLACSLSSSSHDLTHWYLNPSSINHSILCCKLSICQQSCQMLYLHYFILFSQQHLGTLIFPLL